MEKCDICEKEFKTKKGLEIHSKLIHEIELNKDNAKNNAVNKNTKKIAKTVKKSVKKATSPKKNYFKNVNPFFVSSMNLEINNLKEFMIYLKDEISNNCQSFYVHVNNDKNDFYVWVDDLIDKNLAKKIKDLKTPQDFLLEISLEITK